MKTRHAHGRIEIPIIMALLVFTFIVANSSNVASADQVMVPTLRTDKAEYAPGETIQITAMQTGNAILRVKGPDGISELEQICKDSCIINFSLKFMKLGEYTILLQQNGMVVTEKSVSFAIPAKPAPPEPPLEFTEGNGNLKDTPLEIEIPESSHQLPTDSSVPKTRLEENGTENLNATIIQPAQQRAEIGKPVKWKVYSYNTTNITLPDWVKDYTLERLTPVGKVIESKARGSSIQNIDNLEQEAVYEITIKTPAPQKAERNIDSKKKEVTIYSDYHYKNVLAYTNVPETKKELITIKWLEENGTKIIRDFTAQDTNGNGLVDRIEWNVPHLSNQTFEISINVLNVQSYPSVGGNWTVNFVTEGTETLTITPVEGTSWYDGVNGDLSLLKLSCDGQTINYGWQGSSIVVKNYSCENTAMEISKVHTTGKHVLEFKFGNITTYARNSAGEAGYKVQSGYTTMTDTEQNATLTFAVADLSRAFVMRPHYYSGSPDTDPPANNNADHVDNSVASVYLSALDKVTITRGASVEGAYVDWMVVESLNDEFEVFRGEYNWSDADGLTIDIDIGTLVNSSSSMAWVSTMTTGTSLENFDTTLFRAHMFNSSHIRIERDVADTGVSGTLRWVVVEFNPNKIDSIQTGTTTVTNQDQTGPRTVDLATAVNTSQSLLLFQIGVDDSGLDQVAIAGRMHNESRLEFFEDSSGVTRNIRWYVIDFGPTTGSKQNGTLDYYNDNSQYDLDVPLSPAVNSSRSMFFITATSDGGGTAFPRPFWTAELTLSTTLNLYRSRSGQPQINTWQLLELPYTPPDLTNPEVNSILKTPEINLLGESVFINATVTDNKGVIDKVTAIIDCPTGTQFNYSMSDDDLDNMYNVTIIPSCSVGGYNITIWAEDAAGNINNSEKNNFTVEYDVLEVTTNKQSYVRTQRVYFNATGFGENNTIQVLVQDESLDPITGYPQNFTSNSTGGINSTWLVPFDQPLGDYRINATDLITGRSAKTFISIVLAVINGNQSDYQVGSTLKYSGSNWDSNENTSVTIRNPSETIVYGPINETANSTGEFNNTWILNWDQSYGTYTMDAIQVKTPNKNDSFTFEVIARVLSLSVNKSYYLVNQIVNIWGNNYRPSATININIYNSSGSVAGYPKDLISSPSGDITDTWQIPGNQNLGTYSIFVYDKTYATMNQSTILNISKQNLTSDKDAYNTGDLVQIIGQRWNQSTNVTLKIINSTGDIQSGFPKKLTANSNGYFSSDWTAELGTGVSDMFMATVEESYNTSINATKNFTVTKKATLKTNASDYSFQEAVGISGSFYTPNGDVQILIRSMYNNNLAPGYPKIITADGSGDISHTWNTEYFKTGTYRVETIDQTSPDLYFGETNFNISNQKIAFPNADFSYNNATNWQWLGNRYNNAADCGSSSSDANYNQQGVVVLNETDTAYFNGDWKQGDGLPVGGGGSEETTLTTSGTDDYAGMMMSTVFTVPPNATKLWFWAYGYYLSGETNQCHANRYQGTISQTANTDRAEMISFGVWVDDNGDTSGNTNIADDFLAVEYWKSRIESGSSNFDFPEGQYSVNVSQYIGEKIYVTGIAMGDGNSDDILIQMDNVRFEYNDSNTILFDSTPPNVTSINPNNINYTLGDSFEINATIKDVHAVMNVIAQVDLPNGSAFNYTMSDNDANDIYNATFTLTDIIDRYNITIFANDSYDNENFTETSYFIINDVNSPQWSMNKTNPSSGITYNPDANYQFNATWTDNYELKNVSIEHNFTGTLKNYSTSKEGSEFYYNYSDLAAGTYVWRMYANDSSNNQNQSDQWTYVVSQKSSQITLELDGVSSNLTILVGSTVNITASLVDGESNLTIYSNGLEINTGPPPLTNLSNYASLGEWNITLVHPTTENYTTNSISYFITTIDNVTPIVHSTSPIAGEYNTSNQVTITANVTDNYQVDKVLANVTWHSGEDLLLLLWNPLTKLYESNFTNVLDGGVYTYTIYANDSSNNLNKSEGSYFTLFNRLGVDTDRPNYVVNETVQINGTGFAPLVNVTIDIRNSTESVTGYPKNTTSMLNGSIVDSWKIPGTQNLETYTIEAIDTSNNNRNASTTFNIVSAVLQTELFVYEQGMLVNFSGYNWNAMENVTVNITDPLGTLVLGPVNYTTNISGELNNSWFADYDAKLGDYTLSGRSVLNPDKKTAMNFTVNARPVSVKVNSSWFWNDDTVGVNGTGFSPSQNVTIDIKDKLDSSLSGYPKNITSISSGNVSTTISLSGEDLGTYNVSLYDYVYPNLNNSVTFEIVKQNISSDKTSYGNGEIITLSGKYWKPNKEITFEIRNQSGGILTGYPKNETSLADGTVSHTLTADSLDLSAHNYSVFVHMAQIITRNASVNYTVLRRATTTSNVMNVDQYEVLETVENYFTPNGNINVTVSGENGIVDYFFPIQITANSTGGVGYNYSTDDICEGEYQIEFVDLTNPEELKVNLSFNASHIDHYTDNNKANSSNGNGSGYTIGNAVTDTYAVGGAKHYIAGIDAGTTDAYLEYQFNVSSVTGQVTKMNLTTDYCYSGNQGTITCDTGGNAHEGTAHGVQSVEIYNYSDSTWLSIGSLTVNNANDNTNKFSTALTQGLSNFIQNDIVQIRYKFNFSRTGFDDDLLLIDYQLLNISYDVHVSRPCTPFTNNSMFVNIINAAGEQSGAAIRLINSSGSQVDNGTSNLFRYLPDDNYRLELDAPAAGNILYAKVYNLSFNTTTIVSAQIANSTANPNNINNMTPLIYLNDSSLDFSITELSLPDNGNESDYILHCTDWVIASATCNNWEINLTEEYNAANNGTHLVFNVTRFDTFGGGGGDTLANVTEIRLYNVTSAGNTHSGGTLVNSGVKQEFALKYNETYRVEIDVQNEGQKWRIASDDVVEHSGLNASWYVDTTNDIWYTADSGSTNNSGGSFNSGVIDWDTSAGDDLDKAETGVFYYVFRANSTRTKNYPIHFLVNDTSKNSGSYDDSNYSLDLLPDLMVNVTSIEFNISNPEEDAPVNIGVTVYNLWGGYSYNATVKVQDNTTGTYIGSPQDINLTPFENKTINFTWTAEVGTHQIRVQVDTPLLSNGKNIETDETNNEAFKNITIQAWHVFYGDVSGNITLRNSNNQSIYEWQPQTLLGNIFIVDADSTVDWLSLQALGRDKNNNSALGDFDEVDTAMSMTNYNDSFNKTFLSAGLPKSSTSIRVFGRNINNVAIDNSTATNNFVTGVLWDMSDSADNSYDDSEQEDLVFVAKLNENKMGAYGTYDYELKIPSKFADYKPSTHTVYFYGELR